jgi:structural maintenance of chromosome 3 (chondroitin sulfate proteoglycan 6)
LTIFFRLDAAKARLNTLYAKQQNLSRFTSKRDRDTFLQSEIDSLKAYTKTQSQVLETKMRHMQEGRAKLEAIEARGNELLENLEERRDKVKEIANKVVKIQEEKAGLNEKLK